MYENLLPRFLRYVKTEITLRMQQAQSTPSTQTQVAFAQTLKKGIRRIRDERCIYNETNGFVIANVT